MQPLKYKKIKKKWSIKVQSTMEVLKTGMIFSEIFFKGIFRVEP
jgi:hypothetical protein